MTQASQLLGQTTPEYGGILPYVTQAQSLYGQLGGKYTPAQILSLAQNLQEQSQSGGLGTEQAAAARKLNTALAYVDQYEQLFNQVVKPPSSGIGARISAPFKELGGNLGLNQVRTYKDLQMGLIAPLVKAMGESGTLSDTDKIAAVKALPRISDSKEEAAIKLGFIRSIIKTGQRGIGNTTPTNQLAFGQ